jgi:lipid-binding SYLF domain-containing protein
MHRTPLFILCTALCTPVALAGNLLDKAREGLAGAGEVVSETVKSVTAKESPEETRSKIDATEAATLARLLQSNAGAAALYDQSFGYAVFDTRKLSIMITTGFGAGVAVETESGARTYMRMATGGVNVGMGGELFQLVILFEDEATFRNFVTQGWEAGAGGGVVLGADTTEAESRFNDGKAVYKLTQTGLKLAADITGTRYWKDDALN